MQSHTAGAGLELLATPSAVPLSPPKMSTTSWALTWVFAYMNLTPRNSPIRYIKWVMPTL